MMQTQSARLVVALLAVLCLAQAAPAQPTAAQDKAQAQVTGIRVLDFGVFTSVVTHRETVVTVADGIKDRAQDFRLQKHGARAEAILGRGIGLRYVLTGAPKGAVVLVDVVVRHPEMISPDTQKPMTHSTAQFERTIGAVEHTVWSFDTAAGLTPGDYVIELLYQGRSLARQVFHVTLGKEPGR